MRTSYGKRLQERIQPARPLLRALAGVLSLSPASGLACEVMGWDGETLVCVQLELDEQPINQPGQEPSNEPQAADSGGPAEELVEGLELEREDEFALELEYNSVFAAENSEDIHKEFLAIAPWVQETGYGPHWRLNSELVLVLEGEDDVFREFERDYQNEGLYAEELKLSYLAESARFSVGKYDPRADVFGFAAIYFGNYTVDLDLEDRLGGGIKYDLFVSEGRHVFSLDYFTLDTSILSKELITGKGGHEPGDTVVGNSGDFRNFLYTLHSRPGDGDSGFGYTLGTARQLNIQPGAKDERARLGSLLRLWVLESRAEVILSVDALQMYNRDGGNESSVSFTYGLGYSDWPFYLGATYSQREVNPNTVGEELRSDHIVEVVWRQGLSQYYYLEMAFQWVRENEDEQSSLGGVLVRSF